MWKYLKVAVTAVSLLACALLIVLWVRSNWWADEYGTPMPFNHALAVGSLENLVYIEIFELEPINTYESRLISVEARFVGELVPNTHLGFAIVQGHGYTYYYYPYWFLVLLSSAASVFPWIKWRFSLRTLLIVLTLFAVFFGAIAISMRG